MNVNVFKTYQSSVLQMKKIATAFTSQPLKYWPPNTPIRIQSRFRSGRRVHRRKRENLFPTGEELRTPEMLCCLVILRSNQMSEQSRSWNAEEWRWTKASFSSDGGRWKVKGVESSVFYFILVCLSDSGSVCARAARECIGVSTAAASRATAKSK